MQKKINDIITWHAFATRGPRATHVQLLIGPQWHLFIANVTRWLKASLSVSGDERSGCYRDRCIAIRLCFAVLPSDGAEITEQCQAVGLLYGEANSTMELAGLESVYCAVRTGNLK